MIPSRRPISELKLSRWGTRYNLAYINHAIFRGHHGRVLGFDNAHGYHHRHFIGKVEAVEFKSYEATLGRFQREWLEIVESEGARNS